MTPRIPLCALAAIVAGLAGAACGKSQSPCPACAPDAAAPCVEAASASPSIPAAPPAGTRDEEPQMRKCAQPGCIDRDFEPAEPVAPPGTPPPIEPMPVAPSGQAPVPPPLVPSSPGLAAHLDRISADGAAVFVVQAEIGSIAPADAIRTAVEAALLSLRDEIPGNPACLAEILASVRAITYSWSESESGPDTGIAIVESGVDIAGIFECVDLIDPTAIPEAARATVASGFVVLEPDEAAVASIGPGMLAIGSETAVRAARSGRVARPLSSDPRLQSARAAAGPGAAWAAFLMHEVNEARDTDESFDGAVALRTAPRVGVVGSFSFARVEMTGEVMDEVFEALGEIDSGRSELLGALGAAGADAATRDKALVLLEAAANTRFVVQGRKLSFETWLPEGQALPDFVIAALRALPALALL